MVNTLILTRSNSGSKAMSLLANPINRFISRPTENITFQSVLFSQGEFSVFPDSSLIISLSNCASLSLSFADSNIWFKRFILSELFGGGLLSMTTKYLTSVPWKNVCIVCDFHRGSFNISDNSIVTRTFRLCSCMISAVFLYATWSLEQRIIRGTTKPPSYFQTIKRGNNSRWRADFRWIP